MVGLHGQTTATTSALGIQALGAVRVSRDGVEQKVGGGRQRRLLAVLLIHRDTVVSVDRVAEVVFEGRPTDAAATTLRSYVARLRRTLGNAVVTRSPGYQLDTAGLAIDVVDFEAGVQAGRAALQRQDPAGAVERLNTALALWHGDAYAEFADEPWAYPESQRLAELRLTAEELLIEAELACGHAEQVIPALEALCREHPLREAFRGQLMTAHYRAGRQADALAVFRGFRTELSEELGIDPSPALVELEARILAQEPDLLSAVAGGEPLRGYRLGERLGTGLDGTVHAARLPGVDRDLVLKTLRPQIADDPEFIRTFEATAHRVASLRHPAVVPLHDWWREPGAAYVVMPRLPGMTLHDRLQRSSLGHREVVTLVERVGGALTLAAAHGLVHGRVTADNVLYDGSGEPVLTDFWLGGPAVPAPQDDVRAFAALVAQALAGSDISPEVAGVLGSPDGMTVEELTAALLPALGAHSHAPTRGRNPYRGLRAFDEADAEDYFGRAALIDEVTARLSGSGLSSRLVLLVGASGTGKSSAVRAGLLPRLRAGGATGSESWFVATMLPGGAPYKELAESLRTIAVGDTAGLASELAGVEGIDRALRSVVPEGGELLLVVDQFEELFTLSPEAEQWAFLEGITHALTVHGQPASRGGDAAGRLLRPPAGGPTLRVARPGRHRDHPRDAPGRDRGGRGRAGAARRPPRRARPGRRAGRRSRDRACRVAGAAVRPLRARRAQPGRDAVARRLPCAGRDRGGDRVASRAALPVARRRRPRRGARALRAPRRGGAPRASRPAAERPARSCRARPRSLTAGPPRDSSPSTSTHRRECRPSRLPTRRWSGSGPDCGSGSRTTATS